MSKPRNATIEERMHQIISAGLPFNILPGDKVEKVANKKMVGYVDSETETFIPEYIIKSKEPFVVYPHSTFEHVHLDSYLKVGGEYAGALSASVGGSIPPEEFMVPQHPEIEGIDSLSNKEDLRILAGYGHLNYKASDVHAFYDPKHKRTFFFVTPSLEILKEHGIEVKVNVELE